jgi:hypothetical protein
MHTINCKKKKIVGLNKPYRWVNARQIVEWFAHIMNHRVDAGVGLFYPL